MLQQQNATFIHEFVEPVRGPEGTVYQVRVYGREREDGTWVGWLEFINPVTGRLTTERETTQSKLEDLTYWASGLEPIYLEGALARAKDKTV